MKGEERRSEILKILSDRQQPISGVSLAKQFNVSRQVIVQDIALLRTAGNEILSMNQGYVMQMAQKVSRVFKVKHEVILKLEKGDENGSIPSFKMIST